MTSEILTTNTHIARSQWWNITKSVATGLGLTVAVAVIGAQLGLVVTVLGDGGRTAQVLVLVPLVVASAAVGLPLLVALAVGSYVDCRVRNEALDLSLQISQLMAVEP